MSVVKFPAKNPASKLASVAGNHVAVRIPDFEQAVKWYVEKLDFRVVHQRPCADQKLAYVAPVTDDNFTMELLAGGAPKPVYTDLGDSLRLAGYHHVCLTIASTEAAIEELRKRGVTIVTEPSTSKRSIASSRSSATRLAISLNWQSLLRSWDQTTWEANYLMAEATHYQSCAHRKKGSGSISSHQRIEKEVEIMHSP